jgi:hypothetical protein
MTVEPRRPRQIDPAVPRDLETVVLKAISRDPDRRYASARELAEDLERFLDDRPVRARRARVPERLWRWCRRNPGIASLALTVLLLLLAVAGGSTLAAFRVAKARDNEETERRRAEAHERQSHEGLVQLQITKGLQSTSPERTQQRGPRPRPGTGLSGAARIGTTCRGKRACYSGGRRKAPRCSGAQPPWVREPHRFLCPVGGSSLAATRRVMSSPSH